MIKHDTKWRKIFKEDGSIIKNLSKDVKDILGKTAAEILDDMDKRKDDTEAERRHIEPQVTVLNGEIEKNEQSIASNNSRLERNQC